MPDDTVSLTLHGPTIRWFPEAHAAPAMTPTWQGYIGPTPALPIETSPTDELVQRVLQGGIDAVRNTLWCLDALAFLTCLPDESVDVHWSSPPFNLADKFRGGNSTRTKVRRQYAQANKATGDGSELPEAVYQAQQVAVLREWFRTTKPGGVAFYEHKPRIKGGVVLSPRAWIDQTPWCVINEVIWWRKGTAQNDPRRFYPNYETVYVLAKRPAARSGAQAAFRLDNRGRHNGGEGLGDVWDLKSDHHERATSGHPCPTHPEVIRRCLAVVPERAGKLVVDGYAGIGTTGIVAAQLGMGALLNDVDPGYVALARQRCGWDS